MHVTSNVSGVGLLGHVAKPETVQIGVQFIVLVLVDVLDPAAMGMSGVRHLLGSKDTAVHHLGLVGELVL